jgi:hypothetical protein
MLAWIAARLVPNAAWPVIHDKVKTDRREYAGLHSSDAVLGVMVSAIDIASVTPT